MQSAFKQRLINWYKFVFYLNIYKKLFLFYFTTVLVGSLLLFFSMKDKELGQACFTAISAFTNTGLSVVSIEKTFSNLGQLIIILLIQIGGLGCLTTMIWLWQYLIKNEKLSMEHEKFLSLERGGDLVGKSKNIIKSGVIFILFTQLIGAIILSFFFYFQAPNSLADKTKITSIKDNLGRSIWAGVFHSISASNNSGLDILAENSIRSYNTGSRNILSLVFLCQSLIGGIGFPVLYDLSKWFKNPKYSISLFSKVSLMTYGAITIFAILSILISEANGYLSATVTSDGSVWDRAWNLIYLTFSARSTGFSGVDITKLNSKTEALITLLMFIGASAKSLGGGVGLGVLCIIFLNIRKIMFGRKYINIFNRTIKNSDFEKATLIFLFSSSLVWICAMLMPLHGKSFSNALFLCASALGNSGLSAHLEPNKTCFWGQIILCMLMFIGRIGAFNMLILWVKPQANKKNIRFLNESLRII